MRKALVAYDANIFRGAIQQALTTHGFEAYGVSDQNALLALHAQLHPALVVVSDLLKPFGAVEAIRAVRGFDNAKSMIIAITPEKDLECGKRLRAVGADEVIFGGYTLEALQRKLRTLKLY